VPGSTPSDSDLSGAPSSAGAPQETSAPNLQGAVLPRSKAGKARPGTPSSAGPIGEDPYNRPFRPEDRKIDWVSSIPFILVHLSPIALFFVKVTMVDVYLCLGLYATRMFFITGGYHRYFSHKSFKTSRVGAFLLGLGGTTAAQKGPLWWAAHHRAHHRFSDTERDVHSPIHGWIWSHVGWILSKRFKDTDMALVEDLASYPELVLLNKYNWVAPWLVGVGCYLIGGWGGLVLGFLVSTILLWHGTFVINSLAHLFGKRRYATQDTSRNSFALAVVTMGEGWHNNHHHYPPSARQGFRWWEWDPTYYILKGLQALHVVHDVRVPSEKVKRSKLVKEGHPDVGMLRRRLDRATAATRSSIASLASVTVAAVAGAGREARRLQGAISRANRSLRRAQRALFAARKAIGEQPSEEPGTKEVVRADGPGLQLVRAKIDLTEAALADLTSAKASAIKVLEGVGARSTGRVSPGTYDLD